VTTYLSGGELARLDELESITRAHARLSHFGLGTWTAAATGFWALVVEASSTVFPWLRPYGYALGALLAAMGLFVEARRVRLTWAPADRVEAVGRRWRPAVLFAGPVLLAASSLIPGLLGGDFAGADEPGAWALLAALTLVVLASPVLLRAGGAAMFAALPVQLGGLSLIAPTRRGAYGLFMAAFLIIGSLAFAAGRRRELHRLERRLAFLKEHSG
jgi:hypothetical protein